MFLRNCWYVAAMDSEVTRQPLGRVFLNEPVVLFRTESGTPVALADRCCHRRYPLHRGKVLGDTLQCGYHGLTYDTTGACISVPGQAIVPPAARVRAYPVVERYRWIWIWMGDPALADASKIADFHWNQDPEWGAKGSKLHIKANYQLIIDNLVDLTHVGFLHATTIGNAVTEQNAKASYERRGDTVDITRWMLNTPPPPTYVKFAGFTTNIDRWQEIRFLPPSFVLIYAGGTATGTGATEGKRKGGIGIRNMSAVTPETETTSHYFWYEAHDFMVDDPAVTDALFDQILEAFAEDLAALEAQQKALDIDPSEFALDFNCDKGALQARRIVERLIAAEAS